MGGHASMGGAPGGRAAMAAPAGRASMGAMNTRAPMGAPARVAAGGNWNGGGNWHGRYHRGGYGPGLAAGVIAGAALGGAYAYGDTYYGDSYAYDPGYYGDTYAYDPGPTYDPGYVPYNNGYNARHELLQRQPERVRLPARHGVQGRGRPSSPLPVKLA